MVTRINYSPGYVLARRWKRAPKQVPREDTVLLRLRRGKKGGFDLYLRPDEAVAIITVLGSEVWNGMIEHMGGHQE